jgi:uncharacterized lipoprotein YddW (UPF0748 family)
MNRISRRWAVICLAASLLALPGCARWRLWGRYGSKPIRAIWVTRWDYKTPGDIARVMENCKNAGFNTVLFQVRGNGTVCYPSKIEPWADEFGGRDPGFDPLAVACKEAHRRGLQLHAWANVVPGWRGDKPPSNPKQLYNAHPDWFWKDAWGKRQPLGWYCSVNPCYPEVRKYLTSVMKEIVANYPIDGLHLDYIRFPNEWNDSYASGTSVPDYPRDPRTLMIFRKATGKTPDAAPAIWNAWRTECITQVVRDIRKMVDRTDRKVKLTAAVGAVPDEARKNHFQDARGWMADGLVDAVFPMNYDNDMGVYSQRQKAWASMPGRAAVVMGVMFDKRDGAKVIGQVNQAARSGTHFAAFAYNSLFERTDERGRPVMDGQSASRAALRKKVIPHIRYLAS